MRSIAAQIARQLPPADARTDGDLLAGFLSAGAEAEADFAELVRRHGPMVWGVCRRTLPDPADAEDAFQAVFLVLVRRASRLSSAATIAPWLHRVAAWTARNLRRRNARRLAKRVPLSDQPTATADADLGLDLDAALLSLPEKYRSPLVLCHLLGFSRADAAAQLGCPEGTLSAWLSRGLSKLRAKLGGHDPAKALSIATVTVPAVLSSSVVRAAVASRVAVAATALIPSTVSQLVEGVIHMFWVKKATAAAFTLFAVFAFGVGVGMTARQGSIAEGQYKPAGADPFAPATAPGAADIAKEIAELKAVLADTEEGLDYRKLELRFSEAKLSQMVKEGTSTPEELTKQRQFVDQCKDAVTATEKKIRDTRERIQALEAKQVAAAQKQPADPTAPAEDIARQLLEIQQQLAKIRDEHTALEAAKARSDREIKKLADLAATLEEMAAALKKKQAAFLNPTDGAAKSGAYLELTVHGKQAFFQYSIKETDANGKEIGRTITQEPAMLMKLLARAKADATAPKELRVVVDPTVALTGHPSVAFKVCDAAGFKTIKFTGYIPQGNFLGELKPDQKGEVKGYKRYDNTEVSPASLLKQIEEWRTTW